jgi:hypothetical protein
MYPNIATDAGNGNPSVAEDESFDSTGIDLLRSAETDRQFLTILEMNFGIHLPATKPARLSELQPAGAYHIYAERILENGFPCTPVHSLSKLPCRPKIFGVGSLLNRAAIIDDLAWCIREGRAFSDVIVDGVWFGGPRTMGLPGWPELTVERLQAGGDKHADFKRWLAGCATPGGRYLGIGVVTSSTFIAIDVDVDDPEKLESVRALMDKLPGVQVERIGRKGFARFFVMAGDERAATKLFGGIDILAGAFCVIPPSYHSGLNGNYRWTTERTLLDTHRDELPRITMAQIAEIVEIIAPGAVEADRVKAERRAEYDDRDDDFGKELHTAALFDPSWVFDLSGVHDVIWKRGGGVQGVNAMRESGSGKPLSKRKRNLHVDAGGIVDFGKPGDRGFSAIGLVMESEGLSYREAEAWLADRLGIETPYQRALRGIADMPACSVRIGKAWILDIPAGGVGQTVLRRYVEPEPEEIPVEEIPVEVDNAEAIRASALVREAVMQIADKAKRGKGEKRKAAVAIKENIVGHNLTAANLRTQIKEKIAEIEKGEIAVKYIEDNLTGNDHEDDNMLTGERDDVREERQTLRELIEARDKALEDARKAQKALIAVKPDVRILSVYQGQGKTTSWIKCALPDMLEDDQRVLCMASSLDLVREQAADFRSVVGDRFNSAIIYGMDAHHPATVGEDGKEVKGRPMCARHKEAKDIANAGLNASELCTSGGRVCEFASACPIYQARLQAAEADVVFAASANLFVNSPGLKDFNPHTIFVDESFTGFGRADPVEVSISDLMSFNDPAAPADLEEGANEEEQAKHTRRMKRHDRRVELFSQARDLLVELVEHQEQRGGDYHECEDDRGRKVSPAPDPDRRCHRRRHR